MESTALTLAARFPDPNECTIDEILALFAELEDHFRQSSDSRAVFLGAYVVITNAMRQAMETEQFADPFWVRRYLLQFGSLYLAALRASEEGRVDEVPRAWQVAFDLSKSGAGTTLQHLLLGVNAHINNDLAHALVGAGLDPDHAMRYRDHTAVNAVLQKATQELQKHVEQFYAPALYLLDVLSGPLDQEIADLLVDRARDTAW